ncbi:inner membrane protein [Escherichia coli]|nr:inner membrane protein [Escherichia coli]
MKTSKTVAKLLFVVGALVYLVGLWISCPLLSGKGYFLGVLMTATFGNYAYLRAEKLGQLDDFFTHICQLVALITIGLLFIGVLNAPINTYEMVIYPIAFFGNDSNLLIVFYVQIMPDDFVMQLHRF